MFRTRLWLVSVLALASGCLTPQMGKSLKQALDLEEPLASRVRRSTPPTAFDRDESLPDRIWYFDPVAKVYHERRTNTFVLWDDLHKGWIAVSRDQAFRDFRPERAQLLVNGVPPDVDRALDRIVDLDPGWHGL